MTPRQILEKWIDAFNKADAVLIMELYSEDAVNHQVMNAAVKGREAIGQMFADEFKKAEMICIPENIFEDGEWVILEWKDPKGLRGCGFFQTKNDKIIFQRGYWDRLSFHELHRIPV